MVSQRTRNRMRDHRLVFDYSKTSNIIVGYGNRMMVYATCDCGWFGWLPQDEINTKENRND